MKAFYAYPNGKQNIHEAILGAVDLMKSTASIQPWESLTVAGFRLDDLIREKILEADLLLADVTFANQNVYYEMGFAISSGISVLPTINITIDKATSRLQSIGLLDNIGWLTYSNAEDLARQFDEWEGLSWMSNYKLRRNYVQPLFVLDTVAKTDFRNHIFHAVDNSQVNVRSFDPTEVPRLSAAQAISEVSSSAGVIVQILKDDIAIMFSRYLYLIPSPKRFSESYISCLDNSQVNVRSFDPTEVPRLSAAQAISEVSSSAGVIVRF